MDNLINIFMNFKVKYFYNCTMLIYNKNDSIINKIINEYFNTYIDNYYYQTFNTLEGDNIIYNDDTLKEEFNGIEFDLIDEFNDYEDIIKELKSICMEIIKLDSLEYRDLDDLKIKITDFFARNELLNRYVNDKITDLIKLTKEYNNICNKLLSYEDDTFSFKEKKFENNENLFFVDLSLISNRGLSYYRKGLINKVFEGEDRLNNRKLKCLLQKISLKILRDRLNNEDNYYFISFNDNNFYKDKFVNSIYKLIDNKLFRKKVVICIDYDTYLGHKKVISNGFNYACMQDFTRCRDIYKKTDDICNDGIFKFLIACKYKISEKNYFLEYKNDNTNTSVLVLKED